MGQQWGIFWRLSGSRSRYLYEGRLEKTAPMNDERLLLQTVRRELEGFIEKL